MATKFVIRIREPKGRKHFAPPSKVHRDSKRVSLEEIVEDEARDEVNEILKQRSNIGDR